MADDRWTLFILWSWCALLKNLLKSTKAIPVTMWQRVSGPKAVWRKFAAFIHNSMICIRKTITTPNIPKQRIKKKKTPPNECYTENKQNKELQAGTKTETFPQASMTMVHEVHKPKSVVMPNPYFSQIGFIQFWILPWSFLTSEISYPKSRQRKQIWFLNLMPPFIFITMSKTIPTNSTISFLFQIL